MTTTAIAARRTGSGPPVVLLHPAGFGAPIVQPLVERLAAEVTVIVPDRRGYGASADAHPPGCIDDTSDDLAALLDRLGLDRVTVVGVSAGATLTFAFALRHPDRVVSALGHEPLLGPMAADLHQVVTARIASLLDEPGDDIEQSVAAFMSELVGIATWNRLRPGWRDDVRRNAVATLDEVRLFPTFAVEAADIARLAARGVSSSVGEQSGLARRQAAAALSAAGMSVRTIEGAGHLPLVEATDRFADLVLDITDLRVAS